MHFPSDYKWGTATSAQQVEGNNTNNDWWQWEQSPANIANGDHSGLACNWWQDAERDLNHAPRLATTSHRLSIEWSRIEPKPGVFDKEALKRYRQIVEYMLQLNIEPMVTLHHFTNPTWLVEKGDFDTSLLLIIFNGMWAMLWRV